MPTESTVTPPTPYLYWAVPLGALATAFLLWLALPPARVLALMAEDAPLETATGVLYGVGIVFLLARWRAFQDKWACVALATFMAMLMARELDLHLRLTGTSVLRVSYYLRGEFTGAKAIALLAVGAFLLCLAYFVWVAVRRGVWRHPLRSWQDPLTAPAFTFIVSIVVAKVLDRTVSIVTEDWGVPVPQAVAALIVACEEMLELGLPLLVMLAVLRTTGQARS